MSYQRQAASHAGEFGIRYAGEWKEGMGWTAVCEVSQLRAGNFSPKGHVRSEKLFRTKGDAWNYIGNLAEERIASGQI